MRSGAEAPLVVQSRCSPQRSAAPEGTLADVLPPEVHQPLCRGGGSNRGEEQDERSAEIRVGSPRSGAPPCFAKARLIRAAGLGSAVGILLLLGPLIPQRSLGVRRHAEGNPGMWTENLHEDEEHAPRFEGTVMFMASSYTEMGQAVPIMKRLAKRDGVRVIFVVRPADQDPLVGEYCRPSCHNKCWYNATDEDGHDCGGAIKWKQTGDNPNCNKIVERRECTPWGAGYAVALWKPETCRCSIPPHYNGMPLSIWSDLEEAGVMMIKYAGPKTQFEFDDDGWLSDALDHLEALGVTVNYAICDIIAPFCKTAAHARRIPVSFFYGNEFLLQVMMVSYNSIRGRSPYDDDPPDIADYVIASLNAEPTCPDRHDWRMTCYHPSSVPEMARAKYQAWYMPDGATEFHFLGIRPDRGYELTQKDIQNLERWIPEVKGDKTLVYFSLGTMGKLSRVGARDVLSELIELPGAEYDVVFVAQEPKTYAEMGFPKWNGRFMGEAASETTQNWKKWFDTLDTSHGDFDLAHFEDNAKHVSLRVMTWVEQQALFAYVKKYNRKAIFVSHCGAGSVSEAISARIPVVGLPLTGEQAATANLVQKSKLGFNLEKYSRKLLRQGKVRYQEARGEDLEESRDVVGVDCTSFCIKNAVEAAHALKYGGGAKYDLNADDFLREAAKRTTSTDGAVEAIVWNLAWANHLQEGKGSWAPMG